MTEALSSQADGSPSSAGFAHSSSTLTDAELCARIRHHRPDSSAGRAAFGELYARHRLPALHFALRLNRERGRAEDAVAEAFAKIWRAWGRGAGPEESFKPYLMAAVRSESYRRSATTRATTTVEPEVLTFLAGPEPSDHAAEVAERDQLGRAFRGLPDAWQSALTLIDIDGVPTADAAASMDLSPNSFSSLLRRAREGLRAAYLQQHVEPSPPECAEFSADLARFVRHQLSPKRAEAIQAHLSQCSHCRRQSFRLRSLNTTFQAWITPAVLAAALIEIGHFPKGGVLLTGTSTLKAESGAQMGAGASEPHSSALIGGSKSGVGAAGAGSSGSGGAGIAAGVSTLKVALASIAATAAIAAGTVTLVDLQNDSAPRPAAAAEASSAPAPAPLPISPPTSSPQAAVPDAHDGHSPDPQEDAQTPVPEAENQPSAPSDEPAGTPSDKRAEAPGDEPAEAPGDRDEPAEEGEEQKPAEEADESSPPPITDAADPAPTEGPTTAGDPGPEPTESDAETSAASDGSSDSDDSADAGTPSDSDDSADAGSSDASDTVGEDGDGGSHCHYFGWWEHCH
ncbi:sigma-70 family RNA polymerase sigma factor [Brevibacterium sp. LE-L]|uniref:sigma-70 family RNA polymerase sigma factor n=1 Tax=Brevibacterium sp. LE-L TaxID=3418557 RepID=UPI003CEC9396